MFRTFGLQTLTGNAQPLFGDKLTAALAVPPDGVDAIVHVANTALYQQGDRITIDPGLAAADTLLVSNILTSTTMQCASQGAPLHAHTNNALIALALPAAELLVRLKDGTTGNAFLGSDNTVTGVPGGSVVEILYKTASGTPTIPFKATNGATFNMVRTDDLWIIGTLNDTFIAAAEII